MVSVHFINAFSAALMLIPIYIAQMMPNFVNVLSGDYQLAVLVVFAISILVGLFAVVWFSWWFATRFVLVHILAAIGPVFLGLMPSHEGIAWSLVRRLITTIVFGFFMVATMGAFIVVVATLSTYSAPPLMILLVILAAFASIPKLKDIVSDLLSEKNTFDNTSWKTVPGALIVSQRANRMQSNFRNNKGGGGKRAPIEGSGQSPTKPPANGTAPKAVKGAASGAKAAGKSTPISRTTRIK